MLRFVMFIGLFALLLVGWHWRSELFGRIEIVTAYASEQLDHKNSVNPSINAIIEGLPDASQFRAFYEGVETTSALHAANVQLKDEVSKLTSALADIDRVRQTSLETCSGDMSSLTDNLQEMMERASKSAETLAAIGSWIEHVVGLARVQRPDEVGNLTLEQSDFQTIRVDVKTVLDAMLSSAASIPNLYSKRCNKWTFPALDSSYG